MIENSVVCESDEVNSKVISKVCLGTDGAYQGNYFAPATTTRVATALTSTSPSPFSIEFTKYLISPQKYQCAMPGCSTFDFTQGTTIVPYCTACSQTNTTYTMNFLGTDMPYSLYALTPYLYTFGTKQTMCVKDCSEIPKANMVNDKTS